MTARTRLTLLVALTTAAFLLAAGPAAAAPTSPWFHLASVSRPGNLPPEGSGYIVATAVNVGDATANGASTPVKLIDTLPSGLKALSAKANTNNTISGKHGPVLCAIASEHLVECSYADKLPPYQQIELVIAVAVTEGASSGDVNEVRVSGGGAPAAAAKHPIAVSESPTPFGVEDFELTPEEVGGTADIQAGSHPFQLTTTLNLNQEVPVKPTVPGEAQPAGLGKDLSVKLPAGLIGNPLAVPRCSLPQFTARTSGFEVETNQCPLASVVGVASITYRLETAMQNAAVPIFNLTPAHGEPARFGFQPAGVPVILDTSLRAGNGEDYGVTVHVSNITQTIGFLANTVTFWGVPGDPRHDALRGLDCLAETAEDAASHAPCQLLGEAHPTPFLSLPTSCSGSPLETSLQIASWAEPGNFVSPEPDPSQPPPIMRGCGLLPFAPSVAAEPTSSAATSPTGLNFELGFDDQGLSNAAGLVQSQTKKAVVALPEGFSANPSLAAGLKACSLAEYQETTLNSGGCTEESKIGDVVIESPLVEPKVLGGLFVAKQGENPNGDAQHPGGNLLTIYLIARNPEIGVLVRQALKVTPNRVTGQLTTEVDNIPQLPFAKFHLSFRQGQRSPLITPPACGAYSVAAGLTPWSSPLAPVTRESSFQITQGPEGQGCPSGGVPPFHPGLEAGTQNNAAGTYSPFYTHITRKDSEQEITRFSIKLPPGVIGKLAGVSECSDGEIAAAKAREVEGGGTEEQQSPSCPANAEVGHTLVGSGVGNVLAYAPGKLYLAGPYHGSPISLVSITAAKVGPFDLGTVVVRFALNIDHETAEVSVDGAGSDPIPHIVDGIPIHLRDIRGYVDRPNFTLNPTSCAKKSTASTVLGSGLDFASATDDVPVTVSSPFQAADCASLGFKPSLKLSLSGGKTHRGGLPAFKAVLTYPKKGAYANIAKAQVTLPSSEILEQGHLEKVCPKSIFTTGTIPGENCPASSIYGRARAYTPLLDEPLEGPVYLRTGYGTKLPELAVTLTNKQISIDLAGKIDAVHKKGSEISRIRNTFELVPDAPVEKFVLEMKGGKKGLLVNKTNICKGTHKALAAFTGQNGRLREFDTQVKSSACGGGKKGEKRRNG
jgi:hypothetical protein